MKVRRVGGVSAYLALQHDVWYDGAWRVWWHAGGGSDSAGADGSAVWSALADTLLMFPLTKPVRLALLNLLCSQQVRLPYLQQSMFIANVTCLIMLSMMIVTVSSHTITLASILYLA